jgi:hypothetical protein
MSTLPALPHVGWRHGLQKSPPFATGPSLGRKRRESRDDRKLRTYRPGRLWLFTHSAAAPAGERPHVKRKTPLPGESGAISARRWPVSLTGEEPFCLTEEEPFSLTGENLSQH